MVQGWRLFAHSLRQLFGNFGSALLVSALPCLLQVITIVLFIYWLSTRGSPEVMALMRGGLFWSPAFLALLVVMITTSLWIAVSWHRYILLGQKPGLVTTPHPGRMAGYFGKGLHMTFVLLLPLALLVAILPFVIGPNLGPRFLAENRLMVLLGLFAITAVFGVLSLRLATVLPGAALRSGVRFYSGWHATRGRSGAILSLFLITVAATATVSAIGNLLFDGNPFVTLGWSAATNWLFLMVNLSILTTLYGHYVEKRPLV